MPRPFTADDNETHAELWTPVVLASNVMVELTVPRRLAARLGLETGLAANAPDNAFDVVVEATGNDAGLAQALRLVRPRSTLVAKSTSHGKAKVDLTKLVVAEVTVVGSRCGPFAPALELLRGEEIRVAPLIEAEYTLEVALEALDHAARPGVRKVLIRL